MPKYIPFVSKEHENALREFVLAGITFFFVPVCFYLDVGSDSVFQNTLGVGAWLCLFVLLGSEDKLVRAQVLVAVMFAGLGEYYASVYMGGYTYRLENVPAFVPPGHGLVYFTAVVLARSRYFQSNIKTITRFVFVVGGGWAFWGLAVSDRYDLIGFLLFGIYVICYFKGPSPKIYLAAFFITSWLEIVGTYLGTWRWAEIDPASGFAQGNPPSGVAAWYCLVDAVAIAGAPKVIAEVKNLQDRIRFCRVPAIEGIFVGLRVSTTQFFSQDRMLIFVLLYFL